MDSNAKIERVSRLTAKERMTGPAHVSTAQTVGFDGGGGVRWAFCSADPEPTATTLTCFLDTDTTGQSITVHFDFLNCSYIADGQFSFEEGTPITVMLRGSDWYYTVPIEGTEEKDCDA